MDIQENIVNKVAASGLVTFNLELYYHKGERVVYDIKDNLFHGLMLREKDFRAFIKEHDWASTARTVVHEVSVARVSVPNTFVEAVISTSSHAPCSFR